MKKYLTILFALLMVLTLAGCAKTAEEPTEEETITAHGEYFITNNTGVNVGAIYIYPQGSTDKGTNFVEQANQNGEISSSYLKQFHGITVDANDDAKFAEWTGNEADIAKFTLEFQNTDGDVLGVFDNLKLEGPVTIVLISEDARTGETQIAWYPKDVAEYTMNVQFFNKTGETITALKAVNLADNSEIDVLAELGVTELAADAELDWSYKCDPATADTTNFNIVWTYGGNELSLMADGYATHVLTFENTGMNLLAAKDVAAGATTVEWPYYVAK